MSGVSGPRPILELKAQAKFGGWSDLRDVRVLVFSDRLVVVDKTNPLSRGLWYGMGAMVRAAVAKGLNAVIPYKSITGIELKKKLFLKWVTIRFLDENGEERVLNIVGRKMSELYETVKNLANR